MAEMKLSDDAAPKAAVQQATAHVVQPARATAVTQPVSGKKPVAKQPVAANKPFSPFKKASPFNTLFSAAPNLSRSTPYFKGQKPALVTQFGAIYLNPKEQSHGGSGLGHFFGEVVGHVAAQVEKHTKHGVADAANVGVDVLAVLPYLEYYAAYEAAGGVEKVGSRAGRPGRVAAMVLNIPLAVDQVLGLTQDAAIDLLKGESVRDEGRIGYINPIHSHVPRRLRGPQTYLPGITPHGVEIRY